MAELTVAWCIRCGDRLHWHHGNGGQWLGADPPRDWTVCDGVVGGPRHRVAMPIFDSIESVQRWLDAPARDPRFARAAGRRF